MINIYPTLHLTIRYSIQEFISLASRGKEAVGAPSTGMNIGFSLRSGIMKNIINIFSYVHTPRCWYQQCKKLFVCFNVKVHEKFRILIGLYNISMLNTIVLIRVLVGEGGCVLSKLKGILSTPGCSNAKHPPTQTHSQANTSQQLSNTETLSCPGVSRDCSCNQYYE